MGGRAGWRSGAMARAIRNIEIYLPLDYNDGSPVPESKFVSIPQELHRPRDLPRPVGECTATGDALRGSVLLAIVRL